MIPNQIPGHAVLAAARVPNRAGSGLVDRCVLLLADITDLDGTPVVKEYVTCMWNDHDGSRYWGHYLNDYNEAVADFAQRVKDNCRE